MTLTDEQTKRIAKIKKSDIKMALRFAMEKSPDDTEAFIDLAEDLYQCYVLEERRDKHTNSLDQEAQTKLKVLLNEYCKLQNAMIDLGTDPQKFLRAEAKADEKVEEFIKRRQDTETLFESRGKDLKDTFKFIFSVFKNDSNG